MIKINGSQLVDVAGVTGVRGLKVNKNNDLQGSASKVPPKLE